MACLRCHSFSKTIMGLGAKIDSYAIRDNILERDWSGQMFEISILCVIAIAIGYCAKADAKHGWRGFRVVFRPHKHRKSIAVLLIAAS